MTTIVNLYLRFWIELGLGVRFGLLRGSRQLEPAIFHLKCPAGRTTCWQHFETQWLSIKKYGARISCWFLATYDDFSLNFTIFHPIFQPQAFDFSPVTRFTRPKLYRAQKKSQKNAANEEDLRTSVRAKAGEGIPPPGNPMATTEAKGLVGQRASVDQKQESSSGKFEKVRTNALNIFRTNLHEPACWCLAVAAGGFQTFRSANETMSHFRHIK